MKPSVALPKGASSTASAHYWEKMRSNLALYRATQTMLQQWRMMTETFLGEITLVETIEQRPSEAIWTILRALSRPSTDKMRLAPYYSFTLQGSPRPGRAYRLHE